MYSTAGEQGSTAGRVAICIPTFRRNDRLSDCLASIARLRAPRSLQCEVIVADNDAGGGARTVCERQCGALPCPLHYVVEPQRGLVYIRNRLLDEAATRGAGWIAFIDDDEIAETHWLERHLDALRRFAADVASGPVIQDEPGAPADGRLPSRGPTGSTPRHVACNNVVFSMRLAREQRLRFDPRFNFMGGEDFEFFERSQRLGNRHIWVAEAVVFEPVPPERATWGYLFKRHFSGAINSVVRFRTSHGAIRTWLHFTVKAAGKALGAVLALLCACLYGHRRNLQDAVKRCANALGYVGGLFNVIVERYR